MKKLVWARRAFILFLFPFVLNGGIYDPFDIDWLSDHLGLDKTHIEKTSFDTFAGGIFKLKFDSIEPAQEFYAILLSLEIPARYWDFNATVELPLASKYKLLKVTRQQNANGVAPFSLPFFVKHFELDEDTVKEVMQVTSSFGQSWIKFVFKTRSDAEAFTEKMKKKGTYPRFDWRDNSVEFNDMQETILFTKALSR